jgi:hypothetical protein
MAPGPTDRALQKRQQRKLEARLELGEPDTLNSGST